MLCGGACLAGIGFTMAMFISELALDGGALDAAKVGVLGASAISALLGMTILIAFSSKQSPDAKPGA
jgi:NhaA family Na+:H+ antiporter